MLESGLTEYWRRELWPSVQQCDPSYQKYGPRSLNLDDIQSPFLIWCIGLVIALVTFIVENITSRLHYIYLNRTQVTVAKIKEIN
jgi:hypothetical protein